MGLCSGISVLLCEAKVDSKNNGHLFAPTDQKIVRLDVSMDEMSAVDELNTI